MKSIFQITLVFIFMLNTAYAQTDFKNRVWNYHFERIAGPNTEYHHLGTYSVKKDTIISGSIFDIIESKTGTIVDYLNIDSGLVSYYYNNEILRLFDFSKQINDSFYIDMRLINNNQDTIIKNVLVQITAIDYQQNISNSDSVPVFKYSILSANIHAVYPGLTLPFAVPFGISNQFLNTQMANYNQIRFSCLLNPNVNLGPDSKPFLSCFENAQTGFSFKNNKFITNNLSCTFSSGIKPIEHIRNDLSIYPNPVSDYLYIYSPNTEITQVDIYNINGQLVQTEIRNQFSKNSPINVAALPNGIYYGMIKTNTGEIYKSKFVK